MPWILRPDDRQVSGLICVVKVSRLGHLGSSSPDIFPDVRIDIGQFVWGDSYDIAVLLMQTVDLKVEYAAGNGLISPDLRATSVNRTWV